MGSTLRKILLFCVLLASVSCNKRAELPKPSKPQILVSIAPYLFLVEEIAGPDFSVQTIVPSISNPHAFEPTAGQVSEISRARIWFQIGEPFEKKIIPILKSRNRDLVVQDLREGLDLIEETHTLNCKECSMDHFDRHIWLSPKMAALQAKIIFQTLSKEFPGNKDLFEKNLADLVGRLESLDREVAGILKPVKNRALLVSHPAFGYFCKEYTLEQLSVEYEGKEPRPKHLEEILKKVESQSTELALVLPQYNNKGAQLIAEKLHIPTHLVDPYSSNYFGTMRKLAHLIADPYVTD